MSIRQYFKTSVNLPTTRQVEISPNVLKEANQAVKGVLDQAKPHKVLSERTTPLSHPRIMLLSEVTQLIEEICTRFKRRWNTNWIKCNDGSWRRYYQGT